MNKGLSGLDVKLAFRLLVKYPGLSLVSVVGMAVAIAIGAGSFAAMSTMLDPTLPLSGGERIVSIQHHRTDRAGTTERPTIRDLALWSEQLESVRDLGAFRTDSRNLVAPDRSTELVEVAEMTASGFRVAGVAPALGRPLVDEDARAEAPPVVVIAYEEWQRRFDGDPGVVGRHVRLGGALHTVVGVMPEGFRFPVNHRYWVPLRLHRGGDGGPPVHVFGRLADGVTRRQAQAELTAVGQRMARELPDTHGHLRPRILPYTYAFVGIDSPGTALGIRALQLLVSLLLVVVAVNVAILVYARTATRMGEIAVRTALGASRRRVVAQLFVEALVMSLVAAALGLAIAGAGLAAASDFFERAPQELPFWVEFDLSAGLVAYVVGLAVLAGVIVGVVPALKATRRQVWASLQQFSAHGPQMQLGRTWTALIVVQVAIAVAVLPFAVHYAAQSALHGTGDPGYPADEFLHARLDLQPESAFPAGEAAREPAAQTRFRDRAGELLRRLEAEPAVSGVTFASSFPGREPPVRMEIEPAGSPAGAASTPLREGEAHWVRINRVDVDLLTVFDVPVLAGRGFVQGDGREGAGAVIVNRVFAERIGAASDVLGRRVRYADAAGEGPWLEIVGVVPDFPTPPFHMEPVPKLYHPVDLAGAPAVTLALRIGSGSAAVFADRLREIAAAVDPGLQLHDLRSVAEERRQERRSMLYAALMVLAVTLSVLLLSAAGVYAMMSFTVARRRREIGVRAALGADPHRVLRSVFARAGAQLGAGVLIGLILAAALQWSVSGDLLRGRAVLVWPLVAALMVAVGLLATLGPARRGLAIQPAEALRADG